MPPKQARPQPDPRDTNRPIPWRQGEPEPERADAFLPYLALGWGPVFTPGAVGSTCGIQALLISFRSALTEFNIPSAMPVANLTFDYVRGLLTSQRFQVLVDNHVVFGPMADDKTDAGKGAFAELTRMRATGAFIDINFLIWLLGLMNEDCGTFFDLGVVTQGFWCRYNVRTRTYDRDFVREMSIQTTGPVVSERPIIWIWNDNAEARAPLHNLNGGGDVISHWEGFSGPTDPESPRRAPWRQRVANWGLAGAIRADIARGVWRVTLDQAAGLGGIMRVRAGAFLREAPVPEGIEVLAGQRYMVTPGGVRGIVLEANIVPAALHPLAPGPPPEVVGSPDCCAVSDCNCLKPVGAVKERKITFDINHIPLRIVRVIGVTNKAGGDIAAEVGANFDIIRGFEIQGGEMLLDSTQRPRGNALVTNLAAEAGQVQPRKLQYIQHPWAWTSITVPSPDIPDYGDHRSQAELRDMLAGIGGLVSGKKPQQIANIERYVEENTIYLPLYTLNRSYIRPAAGPTTFLQDEVVRLWNSEQDQDGNVEILDFEGNHGLVAWASLVAIDRPFGLAIDRNSAHEEFGTNGYQAPNGKLSKGGKNGNGKRIRISKADEDDLKYILGRRLRSNQSTGAGNIISNGNVGGDITSNVMMN
ncbi:hypothetical protein BDZ45DRAFT_345969 [Acephala macrosclerotiorum]|nr:hypothetical protein BDZ45DRAFT_345969 [Acephala macrosclerotiorum]